MNLKEKYGITDKRADELIQDAMKNLNEDLAHIPGHIKKVYKKVAQTMNEKLYMEECGNNAEEIYSKLN